jgi:hypothetical protein
MFQKSIIRRAGSLFFLGIFLWFYSVKDFHDVYHAGDAHCHVQNAKHFHTAEHHCLICDFEFPGFDDQTPHLGVSDNQFFFKAQNFNLVPAISSVPVAFFSSRAPPQRAI